ncbi:MAG: DNA-directed RNA polymerase subunit delta [Negativicutes bacterium]|nr:DNA-directed RNA polymerase subunit delta [Negativicutes bacterium]
MSAKNPNKNLSETDIAFQLLQNGVTMTSRELMAQVIAVKGISTADTARAMSRIYTALNLDSRFSFKGNGLWGLRDWKGEAPKKHDPDLLPSEKHYQPKAEDYIWDDEADNDEDEEEEEGEIIEPPEF